MIIFKFVFSNRSIYLVKLESMYKIVDKYKMLYMLEKLILR